MEGACNLNVSKKYIYIYREREKVNAEEPYLSRCGRGMGGSVRADGCDASGVP